VNERPPILSWPGQGNEKFGVNFPDRSSADNTSGFKVEPGGARKQPAIASPWTAINRRVGTSTSTAAPEASPMYGPRWRTSAELPNARTPVSTARASLRRMILLIVAAALQQFRPPSLDISIPGNLF
jgi:hypothetical protein